MPAKKKGPSMRESQARKLMMQKIAKGGPQLSGVKKPAPAKPKPIGTGGGGISKPSGSARAITNGGSATMKQIRAKAVQANRQAQGKPVMGGTKGRATVLPNSARAGKNLIKEGAQRLRTLGDSGQVRAAAQQGRKAVETAQRNRARLAAGVGKGAKEMTALKGGAGLLGRAALPVAIGAQAMDVVSGFRKLAKAPFIQKMGKGTPTGTRTGRTGRGGTTNDVGGNPAKDGRYIPGSQQVKFNKPKPKPKPQPSSGTTRASAPSRATTPSRSSAPARPAAASRPASRPAAAASRSTSSAPKPPAASSAPKPPKMPAAQSSFGPVKSGEEYGRMIGAPKPPSSSSSAPAAKKKSSALSQAEIRKRRLNR